MSTQLTPVVPQEQDARVPEAAGFPARYARFGNFQVDLQRQELYQDGQRVKLQAQVYRALLLLLSRAGDIVSREDVRKWLWPEVFLANLEANVNTTMNKLRQVLGDSPETPRYIETMPRRGYSFISAVEFSELPDTRPVSVSVGAPREAVIKRATRARGTEVSRGLAHDEFPARGYASGRAADARLVFCAGQESSCLRNRQGGCLTLDAGRRLGPRITSRSQRLFKKLTHHSSVSTENGRSAACGWRVRFVYWRPGQGIGPAGG